MCAKSCPFCTALYDTGLKLIDIKIIIFCSGNAECLDCISTSFMFLSMRTHAVIKPNIHASAWRQIRPSHPHMHTYGGPGGHTTTTRSFAIEQYSNGSTPRLNINSIPQTMIQSATIQQPIVRTSNDLFLRSSSDLFLGPNNGPFLQPTSSAKPEIIYILSLAKRTTRCPA